MTDEQTIPTDTEGEETIETLANPKTEEAADKSLYEKTLELVERQEKANERAAENLKAWQNFEARRALGGVSGGGLPKVEMSEEAKIQQEAADFLKEH